ncbi:MAG: deoxyribonuclease IV [Kiritimatiellae bacterium]|nr:deoxyribonuclease IV [Kiritimatiellia bacterium]
MKIGCHLSASGGYLAMGQTAVSIGANVFQFFTRNPRGGAAKPLDKGDVAAFLDFAAANGIGPILAHAPYTLNAAGAEPRVREFAEEVMSDDLDRLEHTPGAMYNFHPGSHVGQGAEEGINLISGMVSRILLRWLDAHGGKLPSTTILLETMSGKGSEVGRDFAEIRAIIDRTESRLSPVPHSHPSSDRLRGSLRSGDTFPVPRLGVCLDTCHVWDGGYDIVNDLDGVLAEFDRIVGLERLKAIHLNDSMNVLAAHKDRHEKIGKGKIGLDALMRVVNHPKLKDLPFYLETPCDLQGYRDEIALIKKLRSGS